MAGGFERTNPPGGSKKPVETGEMEPESDSDEMAGGFEKTVPGKDPPLPLPPWLADDTDIVESLRKQREREREMNAEDRELALEQELLQKKYDNTVIEIESSDDDGGSDVEIIETPPPAPAQQENSAASPAGDDVAAITESLSVSMSAPAAGQVSPTDDAAGVVDVDGAEQPLSM